MMFREPETKGVVQKRLVEHISVNDCRAACVLSGTVTVETNSTRTVTRSTDRVSAYSGLSNSLALYCTPTRPFAHHLENSHVQVIRSRFVLSVLM